jgi:hypothetical protein
MTSSPRARPLRSLIASLAVVLLALLACAPSACSSDSDNHPSGIDTGGNTASGGGASVIPSEAGTNSGAASGESTPDGGAAGADSTTIDEGGSAGGNPPPLPPTCSEATIWADVAAVVGISTAADEVLLSITSDELDLAFLRAGALYVAHRTAAESAFTAGAAIVIPDGWTATLGAAISPDGKRLVLVSTDQTMLGEITRTTRDAAFAGDVDESAFSILNQTTTYSGNIFASPALSPDDLQLFLNSTSPGGRSTVVAATRSAGEPWTASARVTPALDGDPGARRLPSGISADARTLFYFNEETMTEEARWRDTSQVTSALYDMVNLGTRRGAQPNTACDRLYSQSSGDIVVEQD